MSIDERSIKIGTHSGFFHADDCLSVAALKLLYPNAEVVRTRDSSILDTCDIVVDVGGTYDRDTNRFDHHFSNGPTYSDGLLMSSFGLVWEKFGMEICEGNQESYDLLTYQIVRPIDAADNGVSIHCRHRNASYDIPILSLTGVISTMNPPQIDEVDAVFDSVIPFAQKLIKSYLAQAKARFDAREIIRYAYEYAKQKGTYYLELPKNCRWEEALYKMESRAGSRQIYYVIFPQNNQWYMRCVSRRPSSFTSLKKLPEAWRGLRDREFSLATGIEDGVFCHHAGFITAAHSKCSILKLAEMAYSTPEDGPSIMETQY